MASGVGISHTDIPGLLVEVLVVFSDLVCHEEVSVGFASEVRVRLMSRHGRAYRVVKPEYSVVARADAVGLVD